MHLKKTENFTEWSHQPARFKDYYANWFPRRALTLLSLLVLFLILDLPLITMLAFANSTSQGDGGPMAHESSGSVEVSSVRSPSTTKPDSPGWNGDGKKERNLLVVVYAGGNTTRAEHGLFSGGLICECCYRRLSYCFANVLLFLSRICLEWYQFDLIPEIARAILENCCT